MKRYVALLRGINVGGKNKVEMPRLKKVFESLGFGMVSTYINTGNVLFETDQVEFISKIEHALLGEFGFEIRVVVRTASNIQKLCEKIPKDFKNDTEQKTDVLFLWDDYSEKKSLKLIKTTKVDTLLYVDKAIVWNIHRKEYRKSGMNTFIGSLVYKNMTARNINTVRKLHELLLS